LRDDAVLARELAERILTRQPNHQMARLLMQM
jgi:hypothetical protein